MTTPITREQRKRWLKAREYVTYEALEMCLGALTAADALAEAVTEGDKRVSALHTLIHSRFTEGAVTLQELDAAVWKVHDVLRPALAAYRARVEAPK